MRNGLRFTYFSVLAVVAMLSAPLVSAQVGSYTSDSNGSEISWNESWSELESDPGAEVLNDGVHLNHDASGSDVFVGYVAARQDSIEMRDAFITSTEREADSISVLEQGSYNNVSYRVDLLREEDENPEGVYTLQIANDASGSAIAYVLVADVADFSDGVGAVQSGINIDGSPAMNGVDPAGMQSFLELAQSTSSQTGSTEPLQIPPTSEAEDLEPPADAGTTTYSNTAWGYTVEYDSVFVDITEPGSELMLASYSPVMIVGFAGITNPGVSSAVIYEALQPTFIDLLGPGGTYIDGGYFQNGAVWAGVSSDGMQMMQQVIFASPSTAVIVTMIAEPGVNMSTVGEVYLNGTSIFGN